MGRHRKPSRNHGHHHEPHQQGQKKLHVRDVTGEWTEIKPALCWHLLVSIGPGALAWFMPLMAPSDRLPFDLGCGILDFVNLTVTQLTDQLLVSYARLGGIN